MRVSKAFAVAISNIGLKDPRKSVFLTHSTAPDEGCVELNTVRDVNASSLIIPAEKDVSQEDCCSRYGHQNTKSENIVGAIA